MLWPHAAEARRLLAEFTQALGPAGLPPATKDLLDQILLEMGRPAAG